MGDNSRNPDINTITIDQRFRCNYKERYTDALLTNVGFVDGKLFITEDPLQFNIMKMINLKVWVPLAMQEFIKSM